MSDESQTFRIGIAMAGAVSAGAYTAGVMDYLLETLERWERAKEQNRNYPVDHEKHDPSVPMHKVVIDVIGGSSAGGMTAAITALSLFEGVDPDAPQSKLFDAWVNLNDKSPKNTTLHQLLDTVEQLTSGDAKVIDLPR